MTDHPILFSGEMVRAILEGRKTQTRRVMKVQPPNDGVEYQAMRILDGDKRNIGKIRWVKEECIVADIPPFSCPFGEIGSRLWVKETWRVGMREDPYQQYKGVQHKADELFPENEKDEFPVWVLPEARNMEVSPHWKPSIFMPRWASRITLKVTNIRAERLQNITEEDAKKEGVPDEGDYPISSIYCPVCHGGGTFGTNDPKTLGHIDIDCPYCDTARKRFMNLWDSINGKKLDKCWDANPWVWVVEFEVMEA